MSHVHNYDSLTDPIGDNAPSMGESTMTLPNLLRNLETQYRGLNGEREGLQKQLVSMNMRIQDLDHMCEALMVAISAAKEHLPHVQEKSIPHASY